MTEPKPGPVFKIGKHYVRTMIEAGDVKAAFAAGPEQPTLRSPEAMKWLAWMRAGATPPLSHVDVKLVPFAVTLMQIADPVTFSRMSPAAASGKVYFPIFKVLEALGLSAQEGQEYVQARVLQLSATGRSAQLADMLVAYDDLVQFMEKTGCSFERGLVH